MPAVALSVPKEANLFDLSSGYGGDEVPPQGLSLERLRDSFSVVTVALQEEPGWVTRARRRAAP